jgi:hypothetical protein
LVQGAPILNPRQKRRTALATAIVGAGASGVAGWLGIGWLSIAAAALTIGATIWHARLAGAVIVPFTSDDWRDSPDGNVAFEIPFARHGRRKPIVKVLRATDTGQGLETIDVDEEVRADGTIRLIASDRRYLASGEVRIACYALSALRVHSADAVEQHARGDPESASHAHDG